jgi:hypothetical protein
MRIVTRSLSLLLVLSLKLKLLPHEKDRVPPPIIPSTMASAQALKIQDDKFSSLGFKTVVDNEQVISYSRALDSVSEKNPILVLVHGYPSSAYMYITAPP